MFLAFLPLLEWVFLDLAGLLARGAVKLPVVVLGLGELVAGVLGLVLGQGVPDANCNSDDDYATNDTDSDHGCSVVNF